MAGASPIDYVTKRNLFFCNSIIEICLRKGEPKRQVIINRVDSKYEVNNSNNK